MEYLDYLPDIFQDTLEFRRFGQWVWLTVVNVREGIAAVTDEAIPQTASEEGISRFESMLGLPDGSGDSLEKRRFRVLMALAGTPPFSMGWLRQRLESTFGKDGFLAEDSPEEHWLRVGISASSNEDLNTLWNELRQRIPANLDLKMCALHQESQNVFSGAFMQSAEFYRMEVENGTV